MFILHEPFSWAFIGMFGLLVGAAMVGGTKMGRCAPLGFAAVMVSDLARMILVLPFCLQPCLEIGAWNWIAGGIIVAAA